ncbi:MAG: hypothetical protein U1E76_21550 [Planctomycetota bacterium]
MDRTSTIGMPVGGLCAGQMYLTGDGRLAHWDIFNDENFSGYGNQSYDLGRKPLFLRAAGVRHPGTRRRANHGAIA